MTDLTEEQRSENARRFWADQGPCSCGAASECFVNQEPKCRPCAHKLVCRPCCLCGSVPTEPVRYPNGAEMRLVPVRQAPSSCTRATPCRGWNHEVCARCYAVIQPGAVS